MFLGKKVVAIIPARGGSKGLPNKNIIGFDGHPLIAHTIMAAQKTGVIDSIIISTDSEEIKNVALKYGAQVPFLRPAHLATDQAGTMEVVEHALGHLKNSGENFEIAILLQPTSPNRNEKHILEALEIFTQNSHLDDCTVVSVYEEEKKLNWLLSETPQGKIEFLKKDALVPRQSLPRIFSPNGAIYIFHSQSISKGFYTENTYPYVMDKKYSADIDTKEDLNKALRDKESNG